MSPGCDLDARVAEMVMGWSKRVLLPAGGLGRLREELWSADGKEMASRESIDGGRSWLPDWHGLTFGHSYSTNIAHAWEVVDRVERLGLARRPFFFLVTGRYRAAWIAGWSWNAEDATLEWNSNNGLDSNGIDWIQDTWTDKPIAAGATPAHAICLAALKAVELAKAEAA